MVSHENCFAGTQGFGHAAAEILCANEVNGVIEIGQTICKGNCRLANGL